MIILILALIALYLANAVYVFKQAHSPIDDGKENLINGILSLIWILSIPIVWLSDQFR